MNLNELQCPTCDRIGRPLPGSGNNERRGLCRCPRCGREWAADGVGALIVSCSPSIDEGTFNLVVAQLIGIMLPHRDEMEVIAFEPDANGVRQIMLRGNESLVVKMYCSYIERTGGNVDGSTIAVDDPDIDRIRLLRPQHDADTTFVGEVEGEDDDVRSCCICNNTLDELVDHAWLTDEFGRALAACQECRTARPAIGMLN